jgi:hypothetical protein
MGIATRVRQIVFGWGLHATCSLAARSHVLNCCQIADALIDQSKQKNPNCSVFWASDRLSVNYYLSNNSEVIDLVSSFWCPNVGQSLQIQSTWP